MLLSTVWQPPAAAYMSVLPLLKETVTEYLQQPNMNTEVRPG